VVGRHVQQDINVVEGGVAVTIGLGLLGVIIDTDHQNIEAPGDRADLRRGGVFRIGDVDGVVLDAGAQVPDGHRADGHTAHQHHNQNGREDFDNKQPGGATGLRAVSGGTGMDTAIPAARRSRQREFAVGHRGVSIGNSAMNSLFVPSTRDAAVSG
jgi:hypothetical protein